MSARWRRVLTAIACALALAACGSPARRDAAPVALKDHFDKAMLVDRTTVLVFWASWCDYCAANLREIDALERGTSSSRVRFVGLTIDEDRAAAQAFIDGIHPRFDNYFGGEAEARRDRVGSLTTVLIVDPSGKVVHRYTRFADGDMAALRAQVDSLAER